MTADQIRAEIARLQQMLAEIEGGDYSDGRSWGKDPAENTAFFDYLKSKERYYINTGKLEYFRVQDGKLVFDPNLAANESEYQNWLNMKKAQEEGKKEAEKREKLKLYNEMRLNREKERRERVAEMERRREAQAMAALKPQSYNQPTPSPQPTQTGSGTMPPAWS